MNPRRKENLKRAAAVCFWLAVWAVLSAVVGKPLLLPGPAETAAELLELTKTLPFWSVIGTSMGRVLLGVLSGTVLGILLAVLSARFALFRTVLGPMLTVVKSVPVASFAILVLLWLRRELVPSFISALIVLPGVWANVTAGIRDTDPLLLELSRACGLGPWRTLRRIRIPSVLPLLRAALQSAIGFGWKAGVAAEVLTLPRNSIGRMIYESKLYLQTTELFAWTAAIVLLSLIIEMLLLRLLNIGKPRGTDVSEQQAADAGRSDLPPVSAEDDPCVERTSPMQIRVPSEARSPTSAAEPVLALSRLSVAFNGKSVFSDLSLSLAAGERVALMGPSGCGKTSLLRTAAGLLIPSAGTVERGTERVAVCFQEPRLLPWLTAVQNVNLVLSDRSATMAEAERLLSRLGLSVRAMKQYPTELSGGMCQRVALARTLAQKGDLLLLDEPFKALDAGLRAQVIRVVTEESKDAAVLLVTHDRTEAVAFNCRVVEFASLMG